MIFNSKSIINVNWSIFYKRIKKIIKILYFIKEILSNEIENVDINLFQYTKIKMNSFIKLLVLTFGLNYLKCQDVVVNGKYEYIYWFNNKNSDLNWKRNVTYQLFFKYD